MIELLIILSCLYAGYIAFRKPGEKFFYED